MYILPPVHELAIVGIFDAGVPNAERIVLRPTEPLNLAAFGLLLSVANEGFVTPIADNFLWFGEKWVVPPAWLVIFTGPGNYREGMHQTTGEPVLELHWGKRQVIFGQPGLAVSLVRIGGLSSHGAPPTRNVVAPPPLTRRPLGKG